MSVQVSYKKQIMFGIICLVIFLIVLEAIIITYDYFTKQCKFMSSDVFENFNQAEKLFELTKPIVFSKIGTSL